jgi:hypothetical protein
VSVTSIQHIHLCLDDYGLSHFVKGWVDWSADVFANCERNPVWYRWYTYLCVRVSYSF